MEIKQRPCDPRNYRQHRKDSIKYIVLHYTANNGDTDEGNGNYFANNDTGDTSAHFFVDEDSATQSVPDSACAFHCGGTSYRHPYCRNDNAIGIEMCSDKDAEGKYVITAATVNNAVEITRMKMDQYGIGIDCVLRHYDVTGKNCPAPWVEDESQWVAFKTKLTEGEENMAIPAGAKESSFEINGVKYPTYILTNVMYWGEGVPVRPTVEGAVRKIEWIEGEYRAVLK